MKHETLMLSGLFAACLLACTLVLGSMLTTSLASPQTAASRTLAVSTGSCAVPGVRCPLPRG